MTDFDIHRLDGLDPASDRADGELKGYQDDLLQAFRGSPETADLGGAPSATGSWAELMIQFGFNYLGTTVPRMSAADAEEILTELFPRKVSVSSPDEADSVIPELTAFWRYLSREYRLANAPAILKLLDDLQPRFKDMMNDPTKFGMAKSFFMAGQSAGLDMSDERQLQSFAAQYNAGLAASTQPGAWVRPLRLTRTPGARCASESESSAARPAGRTAGKGAEAARIRRDALTVADECALRGIGFYYAQVLKYLDCFAYGGALDTEPVGQPVKGLVCA